MQSIQEIRDLLEQPLDRPDVLKQIHFHLNNLETFMSNLNDLDEECAICLMELSVQCEICFNLVCQQCHSYCQECEKLCCTNCYKETRFYYDHENLCVNCRPVRLKEWNDQLKSL